jgi:DNA-binding winged helix-turn-helix (wHTH) protein/pimeloyl-ACP methyl ester carboxylesterase
VTSVLGPSHRDAYTQANSNCKDSENLFVHNTSSHLNQLFGKEQLLNRSFDCELNSRSETGSPQEKLKFFEDNSKPRKGGFMALQTAFVFESFRLDAINDRLLRDGKSIHLTPKAFSVLRYLADHSDQLVTKEALIKTFWPNIAVTDAVLTVCIGEIRKALGDKPNQPKFIETVHRRGYRFLAPVHNGSQNSATTTKQDIRFCSTVDGVRIAYSTMGYGPPIVIPPQLVTHLEADLVEGPLADVYEALARRHTLVRFDMRGTGLSDRNASLSSEQLFVLDLEAVVDVLELDRFPLYGLCGGGELALRYYAKHPKRVSHLVFYGTNLEPITSERKRQNDIVISVMRASWEIGSKMRVERLMPHGGTREDIDRLARWVRLSVSSEVSERLMELRRKRDDLAPTLAKVAVPTLVIHRRGDHVPFSGGRELAAKIPGARFLALEGYNHIPATYEEAMDLVNPVLDFLANGEHIRETLPFDPSITATYLFLDIDGCDSLKRRLGEKAAQRHFSGHYKAIRAAIESYNGAQLKQTGTVIEATFYSASRAVGCALHIQRVIAKRNAASPDDAVKLRVGLDCGKASIRGDDPFELSTHSARQIAGSAEADQVLTSDAVRQLAAGKGFKFEPVGLKTLHGLNELVALYKLGFG